MKGVSEPIELFEVGDDPTRFDAAARRRQGLPRGQRGERWLPVKEIPNNLPQQATTFVGRERELDELQGAAGRRRG